MSGGGFHCDAQRHSRRGLIDLSEMRFAWNDSTAGSPTRRAKEEKEEEDASPQNYAGRSPLLPPSPDTYTFSTPTKTGGRGPRRRLVRCASWLGGGGQPMPHAMKKPRVIDARCRRRGGGRRGTCVDLSRHSGPQALLPKAASPCKPALLVPRGRLRPPGRSACVAAA